MTFVCVCVCVLTVHWQFESFFCICFLHQSSLFSIMSVLMWNPRSSLNSRGFRDRFSVDTSWQSAVSPLFLSSLLSPVVWSKGGRRHCRLTYGLVGPRWLLPRATIAAVMTPESGPRACPAPTWLLHWLSSPDWIDGSSDDRTVSLLWVKTRRQMVRWGGRRCSGSATTWKT